MTLLFLIIDASSFCLMDKVLKKERCTYIHVCTHTHTATFFVKHRSISLRNIMLNLNNKKIKTPSLRRTLMIACRSTHMVPVFFFHKRQKMVHGSTFCYFNVNREIYLVTALKPNTCTIDLSFNFNGFVKLIFLTNKFT